LCFGHLVMTERVDISPRATKLAVMSEDLPPALPQESPELQGSTLVKEREETSLDNGDHERFAHYVRKEKILESAMSGEPVIALCGKVWVPGRDPAKFPICPDCKAIYDGLKPGKGDKDSE
jgi:hypothetical protein